MKDLLPRVPGRIQDDAVPRFSDALGFSDVPGFEQDVGEEGAFPFRHLVQRGVMDLGDDERMHRRLGPDVVEGQDAFVLVNDFGRNRSGRDFAEEAVVHAVLRRMDQALIRSMRAPSPRNFCSMDS